MKISAIILILLIPMTAVAQNYQGMNEADMQNMMQQMQKMQSCMKNVDQAKLTELEQRSRQMEQEMQSLCASGKRDEAQGKAMDFAQEMAEDPTIKKMQKCSEMMKGIMPTMPMPDQMPFMEQNETHSSYHVCD